MAEELEKRPWGTFMESASYQDFVISNRTRINRHLNTVLWVFVITGPVIALGVSMGAFTNVEYSTCLGISLIVAALSAIHLALVKFLPNSILTSLFALTVLDALLVYVAVNNINIDLAWFLVPLLSILFCDRAIYFYALAVSYVSMFAATWASADYFGMRGGTYDSVEAYLADAMGGLTIEMIIMAVSGYLIVKLAAGYFEGLFKQREVIKSQKQSEREKMDTLDSMAEIYDNVNLISFVDGTEMSLRDPEQKKHDIDVGTQTHTLMNQRLKDRVAPDQLDDFLTFTNITTVRDRLKNKKIISADFIDVHTGWFRAQYITVEATPDGLPATVIYTTRNVDEEKRREEHLIRISMTDELSDLNNRRCYEEDLDALKSGRLESDLVVFSVDVNGLKAVNDTKGHAAGDELIKGAAACLALSIGPKGKAYRTGGDEFMAIVHTESPESIREKIQEKASEWRGEYSDKLTMSVGYAAYADHPDATVDDLEHIADASMYVEKDRYYRETGIDRRRAR